VNDLDALNVGLFVLRAAIGAVILAHGLNHLDKVRKGPGVANWFESLGVKPGPVNAWMVTITEIVTGVMLIVGFLTPLAAAGVIGVVVVAFVTNHRDAGFFVFNRPVEGWEYLMVLAAACVGLGATGAGEWSFDHALDLWDDLQGTTGLWLTVFVGFGGAAAFLGACYRPPKKDDAAS
jgi:putative oxidoreductase